MHWWQRLTVLKLLPPLRQLSLLPSVGWSGRLWAVTSGHVDLLVGISDSRMWLGRMSTSTDVLSYHCDKYWLSYRQYHFVIVRLLWNFIRCNRLRPTLIIQKTPSSSSVYYSLKTDIFYTKWCLATILCLWSQMADRKCTHAHWRQCVKAEY